MKTLKNLHFIDLEEEQLLYGLAFVYRHSLYQTSFPSIELEISILYGTSYDFGCVLQVYGAEAGPETAEQPMEEAGMSDEVLQKLQDKATLLTAERKKVCGRFLSHCVLYSYAL